MVKCHIVNPEVAHLSNVPVDVWENVYKMHLQYTDYATQGMLERHERNFDWKRSSYTMWEKRKQELETNMIIPLYRTCNEKKDTIDVLCRPASLHLLEDCNPPLEITNGICYPEVNSSKYVWQKQFPFTPYPYQQEAVTALVQRKHAHVEMTTGVGKGYIILSLVKQMGLKCAVIVPGKENFKSLSAEFQTYFGADKIGHYGDSKKTLHRPITICVGKSLSLLHKEKHAEAWDFFSKLDVIVVDESHTWGAQTMSKVCYGLLAKIPYRFFLSATQVRSDLEDNLLFSIIGPCVFKLSTSEAVRANYINDHSFEIYKDIPATSTEEQRLALSEASKDSPMLVRRLAFLYNDVIIRLISRRCLDDAKEHKASLVLVDEVGQIGRLVAQMFEDSGGDTDAILRTLALAHGETNKERLADLALPRNTTKSMEAAVLEMNQGKKLIMIATGCVQTGASFFTPHTCYNFVGGGAKNRVRTLQGAVGRAVRKWTSNPHLQKLPSTLRPKGQATVVDFDVQHPQLERHLAKRIGYYQMSGTPIRYIPK